jgi:hypothetical protein
MRLDFERADAPALRLSIAPAMVIAIPVRKYPCKGLFNFFASADLCKEMSTKGNDNNAAASGSLARDEARGLI